MFDIAEDGSIALHPGIPLSFDEVGLSQIATDRDSGTAYFVGPPSAVYAASISESGDLTPLASSPYPTNGPGYLWSAVVVPPTAASPVVCSSDIALLADATENGVWGARVAYEVPAVPECSNAVVSCVPAPSTFLPVGSTTVTCTATGVGRTNTTCGFVVDVRLPDIVCGSDDTSGGSFTEVVDPASPLVRTWQYRDAAGNLLAAGRAAVLTFRPGRRFKSHGSADAGAELKASADLVSGRIKVKIVNGGAKLALKGSVGCAEVGVAQRFGRPRSLGTSDRNRHRAGA